MLLEINQKELGSKQTKDINARIYLLRNINQG